MSWWNFFASLGDDDFGNDDINGDEGNIDSYFSSITFPSPKSRILLTEPRPPTNLLLDE